MSASSAANSMESKPALPPVVKEIVVALPPRAAFDLFTAQVAQWWPMAQYSCFQADCRRIEFEPRAGGAVTEVASDGRTAPWGTIVVWDPPHRFSMTWHPSFDPAQATFLEVAFAPAAAGGSSVRLMHSGWEARGEKAAGMREGYDGGWVGVLQRFADRAAAVANGGVAP